MPKRKPITKEALVKIATDAIAGLSKRDLMEKYPAVSERVIRLLMQNGIGADEWRAALTSEIQATAGEALLELRKAIREGRVSPNSLPIALGILLDKSAGLEARVTAKTINVALLVNSSGDDSGPTKSQLLATLQGFSGTQPKVLLEKSGDTTESFQSKD